MSNKATFLVFESYLAAIKNSIGSNLFRNVFVKINNRKIDATNNGRISCAVFVSSILTLFKLIDGPHATVDGTLVAMKKSGWKKIKKPKVGCVLFWEAKKFESGTHRHLGFYVGNQKSISNSRKTRNPVIHHWTLGVSKGKPKRKIEGIFWNKKLD